MLARGGFQLVGEVRNELGFLTLRLVQALPQPIETLSQKPQIVRPAHLDGGLEIAGAKAGDAPVDLLNRAGNEGDEEGGKTGGQGHQGHGQPEQQAPGFAGGCLNGSGLVDDQSLALFMDIPRQGKQGTEPIQFRRVDAFLLQGQIQGCFAPFKCFKLLPLLVAQRQGQQTPQRSAEFPMFFSNFVQQFRIAQHLVLPGASLQGQQLLGQASRFLNNGHRAVDGRGAPPGQAFHEQFGVDQSQDQGQRDHGEADENQHQKGFGAEQAHSLHS
jgi:hypothetical protein